MVGSYLLQFQKVVKSLAQQLYYQRTNETETAGLMQILYKNAHLPRGLETRKTRSDSRPSQSKILHTLQCTAGTYQLIQGGRGT